MSKVNVTLTGINGESIAVSAVGVSESRLSYHFPLVHRPQIHHL